MPLFLGACFVLAFLRAFLRVLSVSALKEALSLPELTRRPRLPVAANLENSRQWVSGSSLASGTHSAPAPTRSSESRKFAPVGLRWWLALPHAPIALPPAQSDAG